MENTYIGIDLGTSAIKIVLIDAKKNILNQYTESYRTDSPKAGWSEITPDIWTGSMIRGLKYVLKDADKSLVRRIGITGQMHTLIVLDKEGKPVRPAILWNDLRTREIIPDLKEKISTFQEGDYLSGIISTGSPAANLCWLRQNEPEHFGQISKFLIGSDYLVYFLTGQYQTDYCEASTSCLYQLEERRWSAEIRNLIGLQESAYPAVRGSALKAGRLKDEMAELLGLDKEVEVLVGTGDNPATAISTGCLGHGYPVISLGTSGVLMTPVKHPEKPAKGKQILFSADGRRYFRLVQGVMQSNGSTIDWWNKKILDQDRPFCMENHEHMIKAAASDLLFYPHLAGDKTIYADPDIRGAFLGLGMNSGRNDLTYAIVEGLCFGLRQLAEEMQLPLADYDSIKVVGGGTNNSFWLELLASVLNIKIEKLEGRIGAAYGIALLAAYKDCGNGLFETIADDTVKTERCYEPNPEVAEVCGKKYEKYVRIRKGLQYIMEGTEL